MSLAYTWRGNELTEEDAVLTWRYWRDVGSVKKIADNKWEAFYSTESFDFDDPPKPPPCSLGAFPTKFEARRALLAYWEQFETDTD